MANPEKKKRNQRIYELVRSGATYGEVAKMYGITRGRVAQIFWEARKRAVNTV